MKGPNLILLSMLFDPLSQLGFVTFVFVGVFVDSGSIVSICGWVDLFVVGWISFVGVLVYLLYLLCWHLANPRLLFPFLVLAAYDLHRERLPFLWFAF